MDKKYVLALEKKFDIAQKTKKENFLYKYVKEDGFYGNLDESKLYTFEEAKMDQGMFEEIREVVYDDFGNILGTREFYAPTAKEYEKNQDEYIDNLRKKEYNKLREHHYEK